MMVDGERGRRVDHDGDEAEFAALVAEVEQPLRRALVAAYGPQTGREALADALAWAWEHLDRLRGMSSPAGYLWRVGQTSVRHQHRHVRFEVPLSGAAAAGVAPVPEWDEALLTSLQRLTVHQRVAVVLVHAYDYRLAEAAAVLGCTVSTLRNHLARGLEHARRDLERRER
ncbi:MAG: sigma-70 family RNA polymerase sigma factor [Actinomycetota bacterium]|nr:sigma-70 family RNA polymerase sigma factor [Actinomycetota bacterium]